MKKFLLVAVFFIVVLEGCLNNEPFDCDKWAESYKENSATQIIVKSIYHNGTPVTIYGIDPVTHSSMEFNEGSGWIFDNLNKIKIGDTLTKIRGEFKTILRRKGQVIVIQFKCDETGKVYMDDIPLR